MLNDSAPTAYTYDDAALVLRNLGFDLAPTRSGSHRKWRYKRPGRNAVIIGLVEKGSGPMKPYLIREMVRQLEQNDLLPDDFA